MFFIHRRIDMKWLWLALVAGISLTAASCTLELPCAPSEMGAPGNLSPAHFALVSLNPNLTWQYPPSEPSPYPYPAGSADCAITGYKVQLHDITGSGIDAGGEVSGSTTTSFTPAAPLRPATLYYWEVRAISASGMGPWSPIGAFYTGPMCDTSSLAAPLLGSPSGVIHTLRPIFDWDYPGTHSTGACLPQGFRIDVSTSPSFADTSLSGGTGNPRRIWTTGRDLEDCTTYYWQVAAINEITLGPFSATKTFSTQVGECPLLAPSSALDCPAGTFFAPGALECRAIQLVPVRPGGGGGPSPTGCQPPPGGCGGLNWYPEPYCVCFE